MQVHKIYISNRAADILILSQGRRGGGSYSVCLGLEAREKEGKASVRERQELFVCDYVCVCDRDSKKEQEVSA